MAKEIYVEPNKVWDYYSAHSTQLDIEEKLLAERTEFGIKVLLSGGSIPSIRVTADDDELYSEAIIGFHDTYAVAREIYDKYLNDSVVNLLIDEGDEPVDEDAEIDWNEREMQEAAYDFLDRIAPDYADLLDPGVDEEDVWDDVISAVCELLFKKYGISAYRPMYLEDDDGNVTYSEHPYEEMDLDD